MGKSIRRSFFVGAAMRYNATAKARHRWNNLERRRRRRRNETVSWSSSRSTSNCTSDRQSNVRSFGRSVGQSIGRSVGREAWIKQNLIRLALALAGSGRPLTTALEINIKHVI